MTAPARPDLRRGGEAVQEIASQQAAGKFVRTAYFSLEDKQTAILRFLTDSPGWYFVDQHQFVATKPAPPGTEAGKWPANMTAVCRKDKAYAPMYPDGCYICEFTLNKYGKPNKPSVRIYALACRREEVKEPDEKGNMRVVGYRDAIREEPEMKDGEPTGNVIKVKDILVVNMGFKNFFGALQGYYSVFGTILDRDYHITRNGTDTATDYNIIGLNPIPGYDLRDPAIMAKYANDIDLVDLITSKTTDEYYGRFFDPRYVEPAKEGQNGQVQQAAPQGAPAAQQVKPPSDVSAEKLAEMQARVRGYSPSPEQQPAPSSDGGASAPAGEPAAQPDVQPVQVPAAVGGFRNFD